MRCLGESHADPQHAPTALTLTSPCHWRREALRGRSNNGVALLHGACLAAPAEPHWASQREPWCPASGVEAVCSVPLGVTTTTLYLDRHVCRWQGARHSLACPPLMTSPRRRRAPSASAQDPVHGTAPSRDLGYPRRDLCIAAM